MKVYQLISIGFILMTLCNLGSAQTLIQTTSGPSTGNNIIPDPIYVHVTGYGTYGGNNGIYIGKGKTPLTTNLAIGISNQGGIVNHPLQNITTGNNNTGVGNGAMNGPMAQLLTGSYNTAFGADALQGDISGDNNTAVGALSLFHSTASNNCSFGTNSSFWSNTGFNNCSFGANSLYNNQGGHDNVAFGKNALYNESSDSNNTIVGSYAMSFNASGSKNCALGDHALASNQGSSNIGIGYWALGPGYILGSSNIGLGSYALTGISTGNSNVGIGNSSQIQFNNVDNQLSIQNVIYGRNMTNAVSGNVAIGGYPTATTVSGSMPIGTFAKLQINNGVLGLKTVPSTATNPGGNYLYVDPNGIVSQTTLPPAVGGISNICGTPTVGIVPRYGTGGNLDCSQITDNGTTVQIGTSAVGSVYWAATSGEEFSSAGVNNSSNFLNTAQNYSLYTNGLVGALAYIATSDQRLKRDIRKIESPLEKISKISGYTYNWNKDFKSDRRLNDSRQAGFLAQEVEKVLPEAVVKNSDGIYGLNYNAIMPLLNEGIKQQQTEIDSLKNELNDLKSKLNQLLSTVPQKLAADYFDIKPNPVTQTSNVEYKLANASSNAAFVIYDLNGRIIKQINLPANTKEGQVQVSKDDLAKGAYILSLVKNNTPVQSKQFLIME